MRSRSARLAPTRRVAGCGDNWGDYGDVLERIRSLEYAHSAPQLPNTTRGRFEVRAGHQRRERFRVDFTATSMTCASRAGRTVRRSPPEATRDPGPLRAGSRRTNNTPNPARSQEPDHPPDLNPLRRRFRGRHQSQRHRIPTHGLRATAITRARDRKRNAARGLGRIAGASDGCGKACYAATAQADS